MGAPAGWLDCTESQTKMNYMTFDSYGDSTKSGTARNKKV